MYHSNRFITYITLMANGMGLKRLGITTKEVQMGALREASNEERKHFFAYGSLVAAICTAILAPLSGVFLIIYLSIFGPNMGSAFCMPFWITVFISPQLGEEGAVMRSHGTSYSVLK